MLRYAYFFFEGLALLISLISFNRVKHTNYRYFLPYLAIILFYEFADFKHYFRIYHDHHINNLWITNIEITYEFVFYGLFIGSMLKDKRKYYLAVLGIVLFTAIDILFIQGVWNLCTAAIIIQYVFLIFMIFRFFNQLLNSFSKKINIIKYPDFWINTGMLFFCLTEFLFFCSFTFVNFHINKNYSLLYFVLSNIANAILYSCISIALLCFSKTRNSSQ